MSNIDQRISELNERVKALEVAFDETTTAFELILKFFKLELFQKTGIDLDQVDQSNTDPSADEIVLFGVYHPHDEAPQSGMPLETVSKMQGGVS